jgi:O-antigen/teichoic acid export membrane protein
LQIPLVELLSTSAANVMMVRMSEDLSRGRDVVPLWHETIERLAMVFLPLFAVIALCAREIIITLFTVKYVASVPIFIVSSTAIILAALPVEAVLRVYAQTRALLVLNLLRLGFIAASIAWFVSRFSLTGAVLVTVVAAAAAKLLAVGRIAHLMQVGVTEILPWRTLSRVAAATIIAAIPAWLASMHETGASPLLRVAFIGTVYATVYAALIGAWWLAERGGGGMWQSVPLEGSAEGQ